MTALARLDDVTMSFGDTPAVDGVGLTVEAGEVVGLLGANGAGKTTLIRILLGLLRPTTGTVELLGAAPSRASRGRLGYVPQGLGLYADLSVVENLDFQAAAFGMRAPAVPADLVDVADVVVGDLSLGARRRLAFAAALGHEPRLLVLDEPTSGVGPLGRADLWDRIHQSVDDGAGALVSTHYMDEAEQCDRLVVMAAGRTVATGTAAAVIGGQQVVQVTPTDVASSLAILERAGLIALPAGRRIRVVSSSVEQVCDVLGPDESGGAGVSPEAVPATLEEAFMAAVVRDRTAA